MPKELPSIHDSKIAIIGLGYVGLPLAVQISKYRNESTHKCGEIFGFDKSYKRINELSNGVDVTAQINDSNQQFLKTIKFSSNKNNLKEIDIFLISVPTPVNSINQPDLSALTDATKTVAESLGGNKSFKKKVIIFESTVYPGVTEDICIPIIEKNSSLKLGEDFVVCYSPERVNPGDPVNKLENIQKIVSSSDKNSEKWIENFYKSFILAGVHLAPSIKVAEAAKVVENIQRDLNIALVNELAILFEKMNLSTIEILDAASTKFNFHRYSPGLVGGHCIGVDPYYLTFKAEELGYHPQVILSGRRINDCMGKWIANLGVKNVIKNGFNGKSIKVAIYGFTYKSNCPDIRNTKVYDIFQELKDYGCDVDVTDPYAELDDVLIKYGIKLKKEEDLLDNYHLRIVAVEHNQYKEKPDSFWQNSDNTLAIVIDVKGILPKFKGLIRI